MPSAEPEAEPEAEAEVMMVVHWCTSTCGRGYPYDSPANVFHRSVVYQSCEGLARAGKW